MEENSRFVTDKLALLHEELPLTEAEVEAAWRGVERRVAVRRTPVWRWYGAAAGVALGLLVGPAIPGWAQSVWSYFVLERTVNIAIPWERTTPKLLLPNVLPLYPRDAARESVASVEAASAAAGYRVRTLASGEWLDPVSRVVVTPPVLRRHIDMAEMEADLQRLGRTLPAAPVGLPGADVELGPGGKEVVSRYGRCPELVGPWRACAMLVQRRPWRLGLPTQVSVEAYTRFSLELAGLDGRQVERLTELMMKTGPALHFPLEGRATVRQVAVRGRAGSLVVYETAPSGETAYLLSWEEDGFWFGLYGRGPEGAVALAETIR